MIEQIDLVRAYCLLAVSKIDYTQLGILCFSMPAIWFIGRRERWRRWGYILGFAGQPFWLYSAYKAGQWGIGILSIWYIYAWGQGIWNFWLSKQAKAEYHKLK